MAETLFTRLFLRFNTLPAFRRTAWKLVYDTLARRLRFPDWHFMNYGYTALDGSATPKLDAADENDRYSIQLYHALASNAEVAGKDVLEVGSGRGGGASYLMRYLRPQRVVGIDVAPAAVSFANRVHRTPGLSFVRGCAEALPFRNEVCDIVFNVESAHAYGSVPRFLDEVRRVLRPGGYLLCADIRGAEGMQAMQRDVRASGLELRATDDISRNVLAAMELDEPRKRARMRGRIPKWFRGAFDEFAGMRGSRTQRELASGILVYHVFVLQKT